MEIQTTAALADSVDLRRAFGRFGTGVTIVTTLAEDGAKVGVTVNSFNTVSLEPPIVLWSLASKSPSLSSFRASKRFVVNVLSQEQISLARRFSQPVPDKFAGVACHAGRAGLPVLTGCAATFDCRIEQAQEMGDHVLFLGRVEHYDHWEDAPLLYLGGQYVRAIDLNWTDQQQPVQSDETSV